MFPQGLFQTTLNSRTRVVQPSNTLDYYKSEQISTVLKFSVQFLGLLSDKYIMKCITIYGGLNDQIQGRVNLITEFVDYMKLARV